MGNIPKPILIGVTIALALIALAGFALGISQTLRRAAVDEEEGPIAASTAASSAIRDATPLVEPAPVAPPKPKAAEPASDAGAAAEPAPSVKATPAPAAVVPSEAAPGAPAPPPTPQPPPTKLNDLPPT